MQDKKFFCYEIFKNLSVSTLNGVINYSPCCIFSRNFLQSDQLELEQYWNSNYHQHLKSCVDQDIKIPGCSTCFQNENNGHYSRRQAAKELYETYYNNTDIEIDGPQGLDYSVGNLCNLKCMICGPSNSTAWIPDYQQIWPEKNISNLLYKKNNQIKITDDRILQNLQFLHFHGGGEPFLSSAHVELLTRIKQVRGLGDVRVTYNTNATVRVTDSVLKLWEECQLVELYFSIDDVEERFEYQRTGANWHQVQENLQWYYQNMPHNHMFKINCVWSHLNLYYLKDLVNWHRDCFSANRFGDPTDLIFQRASGPFDVVNISSDLKRILLQKHSEYDQLLQLVNQINTNDSSRHTTFWEYVNKIDSVRDQKFSDICSEWASLVS